jgi:hypothetical protein
MTQIVVAIGAALLCSCGTPVWAEQSITKVDRLCGYLVRETQAGRESVPKEKVFLYRRNNTVDCCNVQDRLAEVQTKRNGQFEVKHIPAGAYWIAVVVEGQEYRMAIDFAPLKSAQDCEWNVYTIETDGRFVLKTYVTIT